MNCVVCDKPIEGGETFVGAGSGRGQYFAHRRCYTVVTYAMAHNFENVTVASLVGFALEGERINREWSGDDDQQPEEVDGG